MINENDKVLYAKCMELVKLRMLAINEFLNGERTTSFHQTNREFVYLQFRFIFELISLAALCSNRSVYDRSVYERINARFEKEWNATTIIKAIKKLNPHYFPEPDTTAIRSSSVPPLTESELIQALGICGDNLHQYNPYKGHRYQGPTAEKNRFREWYEKIMALLNVHYVLLLNQKIALRVLMNDASTGQVSVQELVVVSSVPVR